MIEEDKSSKWLRHRIKYFVRHIFLEEYAAAEEEAVALEIYFNPTEIYTAAQRYQCGDEGMPPNYSVSIALYEWAHTGTWHEDYIDERYNEPEESNLFNAVKLISINSLADWRSAVKDYERYRNYFINDLDGENEEYVDNLTLTGALLGDKKSVDASISLYESLIRIRNENPDSTYGCQMKKYFLKIFERNQIKYNKSDLGMI